MSTSTWDETYQHWIPQFLLSGFGKKGQSKILYQLDRVTGDITTKKVKQVAGQVKLMTEQDNTVLRDIENAANGPIDNIRKRHLDQITETDRENVDELVLALLLNHPRFQKELLRKEVVHDRYQFLTSTIECQGGTRRPPSRLCDAASIRKPKLPA